MLWPRIIVEQSGYNLAASGAVGRNAYDEELVALELLGYLQKNYADLLEARYKLGLDNELIAALHDDELLDANAFVVHAQLVARLQQVRDRKSTRLNSSHT